jgi:hypothetical protein
MSLPRILNLERVKQRCRDRSGLFMLVTDQESVVAEQILTGSHVALVENTVVAVVG